MIFLALNWQQTAYSFITTAIILMAMYFALKVFNKKNREK
jgi:uncharacterized protein (UPF0212 family)